MILQKIANLIRNLHGWKLIGKPIPPEAMRCVFVFAPHTSNWDFYHGMMNMFGWGIPVKVAIKNFWTQFPFNLLIKPLGGVGIDRSKKTGDRKGAQILAMASVFKRYEKIAFIITPEGSRSKRTKWKQGVYYIAKEAGVPIVTMTANYDTRDITFGPVFHPEKDDLETVMRGMMDFYRVHGIGAKYPEEFALDERYV
ncbi:MAG: 1-acyl-sn-glycerol-3-phosphate acyltransferase [Saprospiraceae bacterium]